MVVITIEKEGIYEKRTVRISITGGKRSVRSAWQRGVYDYALMLLDNRYDVKEFHETSLKDVLLNGVRGWRQYSYSSSACIFDYDIAERLCTPSELKRIDYGRLKPNSREEWLDVQARALYQAYKMILMAVKACDNQ